MAEEVNIGRLVLDIPGLEAEQAGRIAAQIAEGLIGFSGEFDLLSVTLDDVGDLETLAARVLAALRQQVG